MSTVPSIPLNNLENYTSSSNNTSLLEMLRSEQCSIEISLQYLFQSKDSVVRSFIIESLDKYPRDEVDFYLPQLVCLFIDHTNGKNESLARSLKSYFLKRAQLSNRFILDLLWCLESFSGYRTFARFRETYTIKWPNIGRYTKISRIEHLVDQLAIHLKLGMLNPSEHKGSVISKLQFIDNLLSIGNKLVSAPVAQRSRDLVFLLNTINMRLLPGNYYVPVIRMNPDDHIVRIVSEECKILNSKTRAPFIMYFETVSNSLDYSSSRLRLDAIRQPQFDSKSVCSTQSSMDFTYESDGSFSENGSLKNLESIDFDSSELVNNPRVKMVSVNDVRDRFQKRKFPQFEDDENGKDSSLQVMCEPWIAKISRIQSNSPYGEMPGWKLHSCIVKSGDDIRQDMLAYQFATCLKKIWKLERVSAFVYPVKISTMTDNSGFIEPVLNALSIHQIKKTFGYTLRDYFIHKFGEPSSERFINAQLNFVLSLAGYSVLCYLLQVKDRHNGNILLDGEGHLIHVDYGYMLSLSPRNIGFENSPFKLTQDFVDLIGGVKSDLFNYFKMLLFRAIIAARKHCKSLLFVVEAIQLADQKLDCFKKANLSIAQNIESRLMPNMTDEQVQTKIERMIAESLNSFRTRLYDTYQYYTSGIAS